MVKALASLQIARGLIDTEIECEPVFAALITRKIAEPRVFIRFMNLKADGEKLTGTVSGRMGETAISDGTIKGSAVSFNVVRETPNGTFKIVYTGTLAGDEIKFSRKMEGGPGGGAAVEFTAKRSK